MALTALQKTILAYRINEVCKNVDDDTAATYQAQIQSDPVFALNEINDFKARNLPVWQAKLATAQADVALAQKYVTALT